MFKEAFKVTFKTHLISHFKLELFLFPLRRAQRHQSWRRAWKNVRSVSENPGRGGDGGTGYSGAQEAPEVLLVLKINVRLVQSGSYSHADRSVLWTVETTEGAQMNLQTLFQHFVDLICVQLMFLRYSGDFAFLFFSEYCE